MFDKRGLFDLFLVVVAAFHTINLLYLGQKNDTRIATTLLTHDGIQASPPQTTLMGSSTTYIKPIANGTMRPLTTVATKGTKLPTLCYATVIDGTMVDVLRRSS